MPHYPVRTLVTALCCLVVGGLRASDDGPNDLAKVWDYAAGSQPIEARMALNKIDDLDPRTHELADAVLDLARPPISEGDWARIEPKLARLATGNDEIAVRALYLEARMYQVHQTPPDYAKAEQLYRELARRWPGSHWAQLGFVKLGLVKLYALKEPADAHQRVATVEELLKTITEPDLRRDLQLQIGWAGVFYDLPYAEVLPHLIAADKAGGLLGITPADLAIQIGELSFRAGQLAQAKQYFEYFLHTFPTDNRQFNVHYRLSAVEAAMAKGSAH